MNTIAVEVKTMSDITSDPLIRTQISRFSTLALAKSFADRAVKPQMVVLGDDGKFWATTPSVATKLNQAGYQFAQ